MYFILCTVYGIYVKLRTYVHIIIILFNWSVCIMYVSSYVYYFIPTYSRSTQYYVYIVSWLPGRWKVLTDTCTYITLSHLKCQCTSNANASASANASNANASASASANASNANASASATSNANANAHFHTSHTDIALSVECQWDAGLMRYMHWY